jgi:hypothetical protein
MIKVDCNGKFQYLSYKTHSYFSDLFHEYSNQNSIQSPTHPAQAPSKARRAGSHKAKDFSAILLMKTLPSGGKKNL